MKVSVVIPNYNTWDLVKRNVDACLQWDCNNIDEIIVVDDHSPVENYINFSSKVKVLRNSNNLQYTKTVNRGLQYATGDLIILLDSDAYPTHSFVEKLKEMFKANTTLGCVGFKTVDENGNDTGNTLQEPSVLSLISGQKLHAILKPYNFFASKRLLPFSCAVSFRKECLTEMNYLDESFEVLDADNDLSMKIHRSRWKLIYDDSIAIFHKGGSSIPKDHKRVAMFYKTRWMLLKKYNKLPFAFAAKLLIESRLLVEALMFKIKSIAASDKQVYHSKMKGRLQLVKDLWNF